VILKNALSLTKEDVDNEPLDLGIFLIVTDMVQMSIYRKFVKEGLIVDSTVLALHDTNLHYEPYNVFGPYITEEGGFAHQPVERTMVNMFKHLGYDIFSLHTTKDKRPVQTFHGVMVLQGVKSLKSYMTLLISLSGSFLKETVLREKYKHKYICTQ
jgi:hypothetical protein